MKTTHEGVCECCAPLGKPARVTIEVENDQVKATCESHGPFLFFRPESHAAILSAHREKSSGAPEASVVAGGVG